MPTLPILAHADALRQAVHTHRRLVLVAPPGTGKSTQVPQLLWDDTCRTVILQPRRIAARSLAARVAAERGGELGTQVGYQVRHDARRAAATRLLFATYGVFWAELLLAPELPGVGQVLLDEFHERPLEADAVLAALRALQRTSRPDLRLVVMSATLEGEAVARYLEAPLLEVTARAHPVAIAHLPPQDREPLARHAARAVRHLLAEGQQGSILIFMPGTGEIRRTVEELAPLAAERGLPLLELSATTPPAAQERALREPGEHPCLIVATNVAETSLTIPGVDAVVDSGLARHAGYDAERDLDTLRLGWISHQNATQRAGRAGRLGPGRCLRLWSPSVETSFSAALAPAIQRVDLSRLALAAATLPWPLEWLSPPPSARWAQAQERLVALGAIEASGQATPAGRALLRYPLPPVLARVLEQARHQGQVPLVAAMLAILEGADRRALSDEGDLYLLGLSLARAPRARQWPREVAETLDQLLRLTGSSPGVLLAHAVPLEPEAEASRRVAVTCCWLEAFAPRLAARAERAYHLTDGRKGTPSAGQPTSDLLLALELHELSGPRGRQVSIPLYLPVDPTWLEGEVERGVATSWDAARGRVVQEIQERLGGVVVRRRPLQPGEGDPDRAEALLVERLEAGEVRLGALDDEEVVQWLRRIRLARTAWPEAGVPALDEEDWHLLRHELCRGRSEVAAITPVEVIALLREYLGWELAERLERAAPRRQLLPSGRQGRITYMEDGPPELSARLGDMLGLEGTLFLFEGRVQVLFDILAPNFRTVQKTLDMTGFWRHTYPEVKKELRRRYPKHPWP